MINFRYNDKGEIKIEIICDSCGEKINNIVDGIIIYDKTVYNKLNEYQIVHHGTCAENEKYTGSEELRNIKQSLVDLMSKILTKQDVTIISGKIY